MKIAFIGGTRFIGLKAVQTAAERHHDVVVLHRGKHAANLPEGVREILVDRSDRVELTRQLRSIRPDSVVDTFAMTKRDAEDTIAGLAGLDCRAVVLSSHDVYAQFGKLNSHPCPVIEPVVTEDSPLTVPYPFRGIAVHAGGDEYDKKDVEAAFRAATARVLSTAAILRLPGTYGTGDHQRRMLGLVAALDSSVRELPFQMGASWRWTLGHVANVAQAIVLAAERAQPGFHIYNVGEKKTPSMRQRVESIAAGLGTKFEWKEVEDLPEQFWFLGRMPTDFVVDSTRIRSELGFDECLSDQEAVLDLIDWSRKTRSSEASAVSKAP